MNKFILILLCFAAPIPVLAQDPRTVLDEQAAAWNRGDLETFVSTYEDSPSITFFGTVLTRGRSDVLTRYKRAYKSTEQMGKLRFEILEAKPLGAEHYLILGRFFLTRSAAGGGDEKGQFTLILHKGLQGWKIIHDHTS